MVLGYKGEFNQLLMVLICADLGSIRDCQRIEVAEI